MDRSENMKKPILYFVLPCYNEEEVLPETAKRLLDKYRSLTAEGRISADSRIVFVNDGSSDGTWHIIRMLHEEHPVITGISLSRNRGHQNAVLAGLMEGLKKEGFAAKAATVRGYIEELRMAKIVSECNRFDLKSRKALKREQKYYLTDLAIYFALNTDNRISYGSSLENLVYVYLVSNGYQVSIGKIGRLECDFIVRDRMQGYAYIQVAYTLHAEDPEATQRLREREYRPFRDIRDGYPRYIVSLDRHRDQQEGVIHISAVDLFLGKVSIGRSLILNP